MTPRPTPSPPRGRRLSVPLRPHGGRSAPILNLGRVPGASRTPTHRVTRLPEHLPRCRADELGSLGLVGLSHLVPVEPERVTATSLVTYFARCRAATRASRSDSAPEGRSPSSLMWRRPRPHASSFHDRRMYRPTPKWTCRPSPLLCHSVDLELLAADAVERVTDSARQRSIIAMDRNWWPVWWTPAKEAAHAR
jgi:hypothetical protein